MPTLQDRWAFPCLYRSRVLTYQAIASLSSLTTRGSFGHAQIMQMLACCSSTLNCSSMCITVYESRRCSAKIEGNFSSRVLPGGRYIHPAHSQPSCIHSNLLISQNPSTQSASLTISETLPNPPPIAVEDSSEKYARDAEIPFEIGNRIPPTAIGPLPYIA